MSTSEFVFLCRHFDCNLNAALIFVLVVFIIAIASGFQDVTVHHLTGGPLCGRSSGLVLGQGTERRP